jgi:glucose/arabinose dehydrogenase
MSNETTEQTVDGITVRIERGYRLERVLGGLTFPTSVAFDDAGRVYVVDGGFAYGPTYTPARVLRLPVDTLAGAEGPLDAGAAEVVCGEGLVGPVTGIAFHDGRLYVAHRGRISVVAEGGALVDILEGLPSQGDYQNNKLAFGPDGRLYFGQGTATNSGVVGLDNHRYGWLRRHPTFCDIPARDVTLNGQNFTTPDARVEGGAPVVTGAYSPFGTPTTPGQVVRGALPCTGAVMRCRPDGAELELVAWGLRNPFGLCFDGRGRLFVTEDGPEVRGSRPIGNGAPDNLYEIREGDYFGWPDWYGGLPVGDPALDPTADRDPARPAEPGLLIAPPRPLLRDAPPVSRPPLARFTPHATPGGLALAPGGAFGHRGEAFVALFGDISPFASGGAPIRAGHGIARVDLGGGAVHDFLLAVPPAPADGADPHVVDAFRPVDVCFSARDGALYVVDFGAVELTMRDSRVHPGSGALWRVVRGDPNPSPTAVGEGDRKEAPSRSPPWERGTGSAAESLTAAGEGDRKEAPSRSPRRARRRYGVPATPLARARERGRG